MDKIKIQGKTLDGRLMEAVFDSEKGMNLISLKSDGIEVIDQSTAVIFEQRCAGLGALIGPHFHHRKASDIRPIKDEYLFPHFQLLREQGVKEPFSHGIARYVPWKIEALSPTAVRASLSSKSEWKGIPLSELEGQNFEMVLVAEIFLTGIAIDLSVVSDHKAVVGLHYYYSMGKGPAVVECKVKPQYNDQGILKQIPSNWMHGDTLSFSLDQAADYGFRPWPKPLMCAINLKTSEFNLGVRYSAATNENSWQLYHPKGASFVCIEPMSAADPRKPKQTVAGVRTVIAIT